MVFDWFKAAFTVGVVSVVVSMPFYLTGMPLLISILVLGVSAFYFLNIYEFKK